MDKYVSVGSGKHMILKNFAPVLSGLETLVGVLNVGVADKGSIKADGRGLRLELRFYEPSTHTMRVVAKSGAHSQAFLLTIEPEHGKTIKEYVERYK